MTRLVLSGAPIAPGRITVLREEAHHAYVARVKPGEAIEVLDLAGRTGIGHLVEWRGRDCVVHVDEVVEGRGEPPAPLVLALGVLHTEAFAWAVEKATELGATAVVPVLAARVQRRRHEDRAARWQRVADAAVAQCGRSRAPSVSTPRPLADLLAGAGGTRIVADPAASAGPRRVEAGTAGLTVLVGPEGGFTTAEAEEIGRAGFVALGLGPRTLRAETAAVAALALAQHLAGWF